VLSCVKFVLVSFPCSVVLDVFVIFVLELVLFWTGKFVTVSLVEFVEFYSGEIVSFAVWFETAWVVWFAVEFVLLEVTTIAV